MPRTRVYASGVYILAKPGLAGGFKVPIKYDIDVMKYFGHRIHCWRTVVSWLTFGLVPANDCTAITAKLLRQSGIDVPFWCNTPIKLYRFLENKGYKYHGITYRSIT